MFEIRAGSDSDKSQILELIREVFGDGEAERADRRWHWQWHEDPRLDTPGYRGVVTERDGQIIGTLSSIPCGLHIAGQPVSASWFTDNVVHWGRLRRALREQKRRGEAVGIDLSMGIACAMLDHPAAGNIQLGKHVTEQMLSIGTRIGFTQVHGIGSWARLITFRQPLERLLGKYFGFLLAAVADLALPRMPKSSSKVNILEGDFDSRFDGLWESARHDYPAITRRDAAVLNWRYRRHPDTAYVVLTLEDAGVLSGYVVYSIVFRHRQRRAFIVDALAHYGDFAALRCLIATALQQMRQVNVHKVECYGGGEMFASALRACGFAPRIKKGKDQPTMARRLPSVDLYITRGDGDGG